jgi:hypothetical protein
VLETAEISRKSPYTAASEALENKHFADKRVRYFGPVEIGGQGKRLGKIYQFRELSSGRGVKKIECTCYYSTIID